MVLPILGALLGAGGSIGAALIGANAQSQANQWNWAANMENVRRQDKWRREAQEHADRTIKDQKLGGTDALGNRTYFKEGVGWVTELDPRQQELYDYFFNQELPSRRAQFERADTRSYADDRMANSLLAEFSRVYRENPREVEAMLYEVASRGIGDATRESTETATRQALRTGNSNVNELVSAIARQGMEARRNAAQDAKLQARDYADERYAAQRGGLAQLYRMFAAQAAQPLGASYDPSGIPGEANAMRGQMVSAAAQGNSQGFNAAQMRGGLYNPIEPDLSTANAVGAIGSSLAGLGDRVGSYNQLQDNNALLKSFLSSGGQIDIPGGGIYATMAQRLKAGGGII
jgi:hypothetical protein